MKQESYKQHNEVFSMLVRHYNKHYVDSNIDKLNETIKDIEYFVELLKLDGLSIEDIL